MVRQSRRGADRRGSAQMGTDGHGRRVREMNGKLRRRWVWRGRRGEVWIGTDWIGEARQAGHGQDGRGRVRHGKAGKSIKS